MRTFLTFGIILSLVLTFGIPQPVSAGANLSVVFATGAPPDPMFSESDFKPGDAVTKWAKVINKTSSNQSIVVKLTNYSDPDLMGLQFDVVIKKHGESGNIYSGSMTGLSGLSELVLNNSLAPNVEEQYDFSVTFKPEAGNPYQQKVLSFDFVIGLQGTDVGGCEGSDCGGGGGGSSSGGGGSSGGGTVIITTSTPGSSGPLGQTLGASTFASINMPDQPADPGQILGLSLPKTGLPPTMWIIAIFAASGLALLPKKRQKS